MENQHFNQALSDFTYEVAGGGAVRHLTDLGYTPQMIQRELDYPLPFDKICDLMWKHLVASSVILLEPPQEGKVPEKVTYVKEYDAFGKMSFRRVSVSKEQVAKPYIPCSFGKQKYQNRALFEQQLKGLNERDRDYILNLPWPLQTVYHVADERMNRIQQVLVLPDATHK